MESESLEHLQTWIGKSKRIFLKKLSRNDCKWADGAEFGHQNGLYIPREVQDAGFFPDLSNLSLLKPHIFEANFSTIWPATGEIKTSRLTHYSNKGREVHFTRVPKDEFAGLTPASLLIGGALTCPDGPVTHWFMTVDAATEEAEVIETAFDLASDFHFGLFDASLGAKISPSDADDLIEKIRTHIRIGNLAEFVASVATLPDPRDLAVQAQQEYMRAKGLDRLDPYLIPAPGDAVMKISRDIEFGLYKKAELRHRAAEVVRILSDTTDLVSAVVRGYPALDATFLSASQHRKSRAGRSFEQHIARLLRDGGIPFEEQVATGGRRPDFVIPSVAALEVAIDGQDAFVLSAKTTLRERWKQVAMERFNRNVYLATVDDRVSSDAIRDMAKQGIHLVVPEALKCSKETCYAAHSNVITFRQFFDEKASKLRKN